MNELRHALRRLLHAPLFTAVAVLTLALGIGANSAVFSVVNAVLIRPLPYPDEGRLVMMYGRTADGDETTFSPTEFLAFERESRLIGPIAGMRGWTWNVRAGDQPERAAGAMVTAGFFDALGVAPERGRVPERVADGRLNSGEVVISDGYWRAHLGGRADILGRVIDLDGEPVAVVGVMPPGYDVPAGTQIWRPSPFAVPPHPLRPLEDPSTLAGSHYFETVGRVRRGTTLAQAYAEANGIAARIAASQGADAEFRETKLVTLHEDRVGESRPALIVLLGAAGVLLLIASVNLANVTLARAAGRSREWLVRSALGAGRWQIAKEQLVESLLLASIGGAAGLLVATWGVVSLRALAPADLRSLIDASPDWRVVAFTAAVALLTGLAFGMAPALRSSRGDLATGMRDGGRGAGDSRGRRRVRNALAVSEVALACVLAVGAGLLVKAFVSVQRVDEGFEPAGVLTLSLAFPQAKYPDGARRTAFVNEVLARIGALPSVRSVGGISRLPLNPGASRSDMLVEGRQPLPDDPAPDYLVVTPGYFKSLSIPVTAGRAFDARDQAASAPVAIVTAATAQRFWGTQQVIGKRLQIRDETWREVVGVVADVRQHALEQRPVPAVYIPYAQDAWTALTVVARSDGNAAALARPVEGEIHAIDPEEALASVRTMDEVVAGSLAARRFTVMLIGLFTAIALLLAAVGVYGVIGYGVAKRTREMGVRLALGALPADVVRLVVRDGMLMAGAGVAAGLAVALALAPVLQRMLFAVQPRDPATFLTVGGVVATVALLASWIPARRASRVNPLDALREE